MSDDKRFDPARRRFLRASVTAAGGFTLHISWIRALSGRTSSGGLLNAYIKIDPDDRITVVMPKVEMGQGTYTSLPMLVAEELEVPLESIQVIAAPANPQIYGFDGDQSTGGSSTIRSCWLPLRRAGAAAREMLIEAAANHWRVPRSTLLAQRGHIVHSATGRRMTYGQLARDAAALSPPSDPPLKDFKSFQLIGRPTTRRDALEKSNGTAVFGIDVQLEGLKVASLAIAPVSGSKVVEPLNVAAALAVPGVVQVVNEGDLVAVVASDTWSSMKGVRALDVRWQESPHSTVEQQALVEALELAVRRTGSVATRVGDPARAMQKAVSRVEALYHQPFLAHATMEPMNCTVHWLNDRCDIWTGSQAPDRAVAKLVELGLEPRNIRLHNQLIGGGFGRRLEVDGIVYGARIARHVEGPVRVLWSREEDIQHDKYRPYYVDHIAAGVDAQGKPVAWLHTIAGSSVSAAYNGRPPKGGVDGDAVEVATDPVYELPNREVRYVREEPPGIPTSWWRGVGPTRSLFVIESFMDELAAFAGADPAAYRRSLITDPRMRRVFDLAIEKSAWSAPSAPRQGKGIAIQFAFGSYLAQVVEVVVSPSLQVRVQRVTCVLDCGQIVNPDTVRAQLEGGCLFGLGAALFQQITFRHGRVEQSNFNDFRALRLSEAPHVRTILVESHEAPGGVGEAGTAGAAAALCNAIFAACGIRVRRLPVSRGLVAASGR